jgi:hypothetical protein
MKASVVFISFYFLITFCYAETDSQISSVSTEKKSLSNLSSEDGELLGSLGFGAMTIDAYYELTLAKGFRTDNHLKGIDKLTMEKWGVTFSEIAKQSESRSGRNFREEAHAMVKAALQRFGGADTPGMKKWFSLFEELHNSNLEKFHSKNN